MSLAIAAPILALRACVVPCAGGGALAGPLTGYQTTDCIMEPMLADPAASNNDPERVAMGLTNRPQKKSSLLRLEAGGRPLNICMTKKRGDRRWVGNPPRSRCRRMSR